MKTNPLARIVTATAALTITLVGCAPLGETTQDAPATQSAVSSPAAPEGESAATVSDEQSALAVLDGLTVKGRAPKTGYDRESFGWRDDVDRNGCDTRNDILRRDLHDITVKPGTEDCVILTGVLDDAFSGQTLAFDQRQSGVVDVDHLVALSDAHQTGAASWDDDTRRAFANDPLNLLSVDAGLNRQKGDADAATWLPPNKGFRCDYVARQIAVKAKYDLWVKPAEKQAMVGVLQTCPDQSIPETADAPVEAPSAPAPDQGETEQDAPSVEGASFGSCAQARESGAAPLHRGSAGYNERLDGDGDGVACE